MVGSRQLVRTNAPVEPTTARRLPEQAPETILAVYLWVRGVGVQLAKPISRRAARQAPANECRPGS